MAQEENDSWLAPSVDEVSCLNVSNNFTLKVDGGEGFTSVKSIVIDWGDGSITRVNSPVVGVFTYNHTYTEAKNYTIRVTPYSNTAETQAVADQVKTATIKIRSCVLPVNPNIHIYNKN
ncbi:hypothetical protein D0T84_12175 [Dysgonomonas sp. 521]|nr:hypothetical protein [Dysgonomonas sp. 521]